MGMSWMNETAADRAGSTVQILVAAPHGKVGSRLAQVQGYIADGVRQVEADRRARALRGSRDAVEVEGLSRAKLHTGPKDQGDLPAVHRQSSLDSVFIDEVLSR